ncbi:MAG: hypothetical protein H7X92_07670 [Chitinophagales bacterium]|nr:hypothetical protein [Hyphomicrobiales bacterium]
MQTLQRANDIGLEVVLLPEWYDVDDKSAFQILAGEVLDGAYFSPRLKSSRAPHSAALMRRLMSGDDFLKRVGFVEALEKAAS